MLQPDFFGKKYQKAPEMLSERGGGLCSLRWDSQQFPRHIKTDNYRLSTKGKQQYHFSDSLAGAEKQRADLVTNMRRYI
jgi:hypothetical protein